MLTCRAVAERASRYLDADLPWRERIRIRTHLALCRSCARHMQQLRMMIDALPAAAAAIEPADEAAADRVMAQLSALGVIPVAPTAAPSARAPSRLVGDVLVAGLAGLVAWEVFARGLAPLWLGFALDPRVLIDAALDIRGPAALAVHLCTGLLVFPLAFLLIALPVARLLVPRLPWWVTAVGFGVVLWIIAAFVIASLMAGMPPFFGFGAVAWASLIGHAALALAMATTARLRAKPS